MKKCPICKAGTFDDAEVCYGCLHRFTPEDAPQVVLPKSRELHVREGGNVIGLGAPSEVRGGRAGDAAQPLIEPAQHGFVDAKPLAVTANSSDVEGVSKTVEVPVRGADFVVRIELVEVESREQGDVELHGDAMPGTASECIVLRRGRRPSVVDNARPAEARRGAAAGQKGEYVQETRARHAAVTCRKERQAEIA